MTNPILIEVRRGPMVESHHRGAAAVIDSHGRRVAAWGDADALVFPRSAAKPLQALPLIESGAADRFALGSAELALACASHSGEPEHVRRVARWLHRIGIGEDGLICGAQAPLSETAAAVLVRAQSAPTRLHNNCSGKHAGFATLARHLGGRAEGYGEPDHPVQRLVRGTLAEMGRTDLSDALAGIDGCGVPVFALPLASLARAFAGLAAPAYLSETLAAAARRIVAAMTASPWLVGGTGRFDTAVMEQAGGAIVVKSGAEGIAAAGLPAHGLGIAVKIDDGAKRACDAAMAALLLRFAGAPGALGDALESRARVPLLNTLGHPVGLLRPVPGWPDLGPGGMTRA